MNRPGPVLPGQTLGIFGGGQLGRMTAMAARSLGYHIHALDPDPTCAARFVVEECITASFEDVKAAERLASKCQVVTLEIEKVSVASLEAAAALAPVRPGPDVLRMIQDRIQQKTWLAKSGFPVGPFRPVSSAEELEAAVRELGGTCYVKSSRGGYDGRGQVVVHDGAEARAAWTTLGGQPCVVEKGLPLRLELSVLVARRPQGESVAYAPALNHHVRGILEWSVLPGPMPADIAAQAMEMGRALAEKLKLEGLLVTEFFLTEDGRLLVNEMAPRSHNTFHTTEVACMTSQFEQAVRSVCDLPLGSVEILRPGAIVNLLGDLWLGARPPDFEAALKIPGVNVHLYGKREAKPARKMGHLSALGPTAEAALANVLEAQKRLAGER